MTIHLDVLATVHNDRKLIKDDQWGDVHSTIILSSHLPDESLLGLDAFSHVHLIFFFDKVEHVVEGSRRPRHNPDWPEVGIFAQRGKSRPNRLGLTCARVVSVGTRSFVVEGLDAIDGTPILDIKPVMREFLPRQSVAQPDWAVELMKTYWS